MYPEHAFKFCRKSPLRAGLYLIAIYGCLHVRYISGFVLITYALITIIIVIIIVIAIVIFMVIVIIIIMIVMITIITIIIIRPLAPSSQGMRP